MFKKLPLLLLTATCLVAFIINSCKKDAHPDQQNKVSDPAIAQAKSWYESTYPTGNKLNSLATTGNKDLSQLIKPDWQHTASYSRFNQQVIEMPVDPSVKFGSAIKNMTTGQITNNAYSRSSFILLNNGTGYDAYVMTLIADSVYIKNDLSKLTRNTYSKREADFSGLVLYFTPKGKYVSGWRYKDGHIVIPGAGTPNKKVQDIAGPKLTPHNMEPTEDCIDWFWVTYDNGVPIDYQYLYTTCATPGQGGGGDAGNTPPDCPPGTSRTQSTGHLAVNNMPPPPPDDGGGGFPSPTTPGPCVVDAPVKDPCAEKNKVNAIAANTVISNQNAQILANSTTNEYGAEQTLRSLSSTTDYLNTTVRTDNATGAFDAVFHWDSTNGYTIGWSHGHPGNSAPSPDDVFGMANVLLLLRQSGASQKDVQFYQNNVSTTVVTKTGNYVVTVNDWNKLQGIYNNFSSSQISKDSFDDSYNLLTTTYSDDNNVPQAERQTYALLKTFGSSINVYKVSAGSTNYEPLTLSGADKVVTVGCP